MTTLIKNAPPASTKVGRNSMVTVRYTLRDGDGNPLETDSTSDTLVYIHGHSTLLPGLEAALEGAAPGQRLTVVLPPEKAYGPRRENLVFEAHRDNLPPELDLREGMQLLSGSDDRRFRLRVIKLTEQGALVDGNHPLAGKTLHFTLQVQSVRPATLEELNHHRG